MCALKGCIVRVGSVVRVVERRSGQSEDRGVDGECETKEGEDCIDLDLS